MSIAAEPTTVTFPAPVLPTNWSIADLQAHLGGIPLSRIRLYPPPGMATEEEALRLRNEEGVLCEVVDGVLVEKAMGTYESALAAFVLSQIGQYLAANPIGFLLGADGILRLRPGKSRIPDVAVLLWDRFPNRRVPKERVWSLAPDVAIEVLSESNTRAEIDGKLDEYFAGGTKLAWIIDPDGATADIYTARQSAQQIDPSGFLDGGQVLPGLRLSLKTILEAIPRER